MTSKSNSGLDLPAISIRDGVIINFSISVLSLFEVEETAHLIGREIEDFFPVKQCNGTVSATSWVDKVQESQKNGIQTFPWKFRSSKGTDHEVQVSLIFHEGLSVAFLNLETNSDKSWEEFKHKQRRLSEINQHIEEGIFRCSAENGFYYVNKAFVKMFGYSDDSEIMRLSSKEHFKFYDHQSDWRETIDLLREKGFIRNREVLFRRKDKSRFWGLQSCYLHSDENNNTYIDGIVIDISHIKESENLLREKNQALQKIQEEMDGFVYSVSHDLRAPLSSLLGLLNLAEKEEDSKQLQVFINLMKKSVKKLDHFINEIIDYTRNARLKVEDNRINLDHLAKKILNDIEYMEGISKIKKSVNIFSKSEFMTDQRRLSIILTNLVTNSILYHDFTKDNPFIEINGYIDTETARIEVIDNGRGIPAIHLDKIFKMFYRATEDSKGSGLGLFMVKECVEKLEGRINVSSTYGIGTKFEVVLRNFKSRQHLPKQHAMRRTSY